MRKTHLLYSTASASLMAIAATAFSVPALAQEGGDAAIEASEIVVTARRKDERLQDVPLTVNAVSAEDLSKLSIRRFEDIAATAPGLNMKSDAGGYAPSATVRGVNYDTFASGLNGTIEFYMNDAPTSAGAIFQTMFDMGQVELLRGPQGTLRGRATPSGSMTVTTHRVNMTEIGGYVSGTATDIGGINANGAINIPVINDVLAIRAAALVDENEGNRVRSINNGTRPYSRTSAGRVSVRFEPTSNLKFDFMYQKMIQKSHQFDQVLSTGLTMPVGYAGTTALITANDRLSVEDTPRNLRQEYQIFNGQAEWAFAGQKLNYVGSLWRQRVDTTDVTDKGDFFGTGYPAAVQGYGQYTLSKARNISHELRLSSEEPLFGKLDYIVGGFISQLEPPSDVRRPTVLRLYSGVTLDANGKIVDGTGTPTNTFVVSPTAINRGGRSKEKSLFGNLTYHLGDATEISGGARYIYYENYGTLNVPASGIINAVTDNDHYNAVIYSASVKHRFSDDLMVYASTGSSWRPGINVVGDFNPLSLQTANERAFTKLAPERSKSYEIGFKSSFLNKRVRLNVTAYHQDFTNYPFRVGGSGVYYASVTGLSGGVPVYEARQFNFVGAVPVKVDGIELEGNFQATREWNMSGNFSYSNSKIKNGLVPCDNYGVAVPTVTDILTAGGPMACTANHTASIAPKWAATLQSEYARPLSQTVSGYLRGMLQLYGNSANDPAYSRDDYKGYALLNLYAGIRDPKGAWEISLYGKNVTKTKRILSYDGNNPVTTSYTPWNGARGTGTGVTQQTAYYGISTNAPREFGINLRYAFGSR